MVKSLQIGLVLLAVAVTDAQAGTLLPKAVPANEFPVRYVSLGDSLAAGFKALPATNGFAYRLYLDEAYGTYARTAFANLAIQGATSEDVLKYQVPQVHLLQPTVVTLSVGGNDLLTLLANPDPASAEAVLKQYSANLYGILTALCSKDTGNMAAGGSIYINNLYMIDELARRVPAMPTLITWMNEAIEATVKAARPGCEAINVDLGIADVYAALEGQSDVFLIDLYVRKGVKYDEVHPTNKGYRLMEQAYLALLDHKHGRHHRRTHANDFHENDSHDHKR
jgi:lysophospholipase L1-like esterase